MRPRTLSLLALLLLAGTVGSDAPLRAEEDGPASAPIHPQPWRIAAMPDGDTLFVACGPQRRVGVIDVSRREVRASWPLDGPPRGLGVSPDGTRVAVSTGPSDTIHVFDTGSGEEITRFTCRVDPEGLAFDGTGSRLFVANRLSRDVAAFDLESGAELARVPAHHEPFALRSAPDGRTVAAVSRRASIVAPEAMPYAEVTLVDTASLNVRQVVRLPSCHLAEAAAFTPDSRYLLIPAIRVRNRVPLVQVARGWVLSTVLAVIDVETGDVALMPLQYVNRGFADPAGVAVSVDGTRAYVTSGGCDEVAVIDLPALLARLDEGRPELPERFSLARDYVLQRVPVGDNPRGLVWLGGAESNDVAVSNRLDDDVWLLDREGNVRARVPLGSPIPDDALHRGQRAFFDASYCFQNMFSCTSCHPEAHTDGLTYDFEIDGIGRNLVLNRSLRGLDGTAPFKWIGINPSIQRQCGLRFAMVLTRAATFPPDTLRDMEAFILSLSAHRPPFDPDVAGEAERASWERGRQIFARSRRKDGTRLRPGERCITCHPPPHYTNRQRTDVGTRGPGDDHAAFDVPHLTGTAANAPYLHDGRAATLEAVIRDTGDRHGFVGDLSDDEIRDLVLYLRSL